MSHAPCKTAAAIFKFAEPGSRKFLLPFHLRAIHLVYGTVFSVGSIAIRSYAFMLAVAFLVGALMAIRRAKRYGVPSHEILNLTNVIIIASILGSRALFVLEHQQAFLHDPLTILYVWQGGFSYYGAILFALGASVIWARIRGIAVRQILDIFAPSLALGFFFVRIGCFLNGCCFGKPTSMPWGVTFPANSPAGFVYSHTAIHPTQIYEAISGLIALVVLLILDRKWHLDRQPGLLFFSFLILSGLWRFVIEFYRHHEAGLTLMGDFSSAQAYSIGIIMVAATAITLVRKTDIRR